MYCVCVYDYLFTRTWSLNRPAVGTVQPHVFRQRVFSLFLSYRIRSPVKLPADPVLSSHMDAPTTTSPHNAVKKQQPGPPRGTLELDTSSVEVQGVEAADAQQQEVQGRSSRHSDRQSGRWFPWWHRQSSAGVPRDRSGRGRGSGGDVSGDVSPDVSARSHSAKERDEQPNFAAAWMALGVNKDG